MAVAPSPATARRMSQTNARTASPTKPPAPSSGLARRGRQPKNVVIDLSSYREPQLPRLPAGLRRSDAATELTAIPAEAVDWIFGAIGAGCAVADIEAKLGLPVGAISAYVVSSPEATTRASIAYVAAADRHDRQARQLTVTAAGMAHSSASARFVLATSNSLRSQAEGLRRLSESLGRRLTALSEHREQKAREAAARQYADQIEAQKAAQRRRQREIAEDMFKRMGNPTPPPVHAIRPDPEPFNDIEIEAMPPMTALAYNEALDDGDEKRALKIMAAVRKAWRAWHAAQAQAHGDQNATTN